MNIFFFYILHQDIIKKRERKVGVCVQGLNKDLGNVIKWRSVWKSCVMTDCLGFSSWHVIIISLHYLFIFLKKHWEVLILSVSWQKCTVNSKKYYLCYKDYSTIDSKILHLKVNCLIIMLSKSFGLEWINPSICSAQYRIY